jgi:replication factor C subunit 2/4
MKNIINIYNIKMSYNYIPWIEKYRPIKIEDILLDIHIQKKVQQFIENLEIPNIIISGIPGIGKTTTIKCITTALYGKYKHDAVLELNAANDRGIKSVLQSMTTFCKKKIDLNINLDERKYANHKIIILDEADNETIKAQNQLNNLMEKYYNTTRFVFTCNISSKIIESIQSKCILMHYSKVTIEKITSRLDKICQLESVEHENKSLETIAQISNGDVRLAINNLQLIYNAYGKIIEDKIYDICNKPKQIQINKILDACKNKSYGKAIKNILELQEEGFSEFDIILNMIFVIRNGNSNLDEKTKILFLNKICYTFYIISKGFNTRLQLTACISGMIKSINI